MRNYTDDQVRALISALNVLINFYLACGKVEEAEKLHFKVWAYELSLPHRK